VASIHASILQKAPNGVSFYLRDFPQMTSMKYGDVRRRFSTSILCGCFSADDRMPHLNPSDDYVFQEDDKLIFLSNTGGGPSGSTTQPVCLIAQCDTNE